MLFDFLVILLYVVMLKFVNFSDRIVLVKLLKLLIILLVFVKILLGVDGYI